MPIRVAVFLATLAMLESRVALAQQYVVPERETVAYSQGIGRIAWTRPKDLKAIFAVPHFSAGPRIKCSGEAYECEIEVHSRDISITNEARLSQFEAAIKQLPESGSGGKSKVAAYGNAVTYATLQNAGSSRQRTLGYALKGPALIRFEAVTSGPDDLALILQLVDAASAVDALEMWALRFGDYKATCEARFPAYRKANESAFLSSPFANVDLVRYFMSLAPSVTGDAARQVLDRSRASFGQSLDAEPPDRRQSFCEGFPRWIAEAAKDVQQR